MRKTRVLGFALTLAATMVVGSAMGQVEGGSNFVELKNQTTGGVQGTSFEDFSLVQINKAFGYYALPSAGFHPGYVTPNWVLTNGFSWTWTAPTKVASSTVTFSNATGTSSGASNEKANYTTITVDKVGSYTIQVSEAAPAAFGGCNGTPSSFNLIAFPEPSFTMNTPASTNAICGPNAAAVPFSAVITSSGTPTVKYRIEKWSVTVNGTTGVKTPNAFIADLVSNKTETFTNATQVGWNYDVATGTYAGIADTHASIAVKTPLVTGTASLATYDFVYNAAVGQLVAPTSTEGSIIVYRLYVEGVNGLISRKADYTQASGTAGTFSLYPTTVPSTSNSANYYDVYVAAAPKTGPVYHIGNNIAK
jgi:hypothetical protein